MPKRRLPRFFFRESRSSFPAFSLVEVAIALGVFTFAVIALVGLLSAGLRTEKSAHQDTALGNIVSYVLSDLRGSRYAQVTGETLAAPKATFSRWYEFDADGTIVVSGTGATLPTPATNSVYRCAARGQQVASPRRMQVTGIIEFPLMAASTNREKETFVTTLTPYEAVKQ